MTVAASAHPQIADRHLSVLLGRCVELLAPALRAPGAVLVDGTLGLGGHSEAVLAAIPTVRVIGIDRDPQALALACDRLRRFGDRFTGVYAVNDQLPQVLRDLGIPQVQGVLLDLGLSSLQIDTPERGFSYAQDAPLDMRMDPSSPQSAADLVNHADPDQLRRLLREYGEEPHAARIVRAISARREHGPITRTGELAALIADAVPAQRRSSNGAQRKAGHPAKRTFQALRIAVNGELDALATVLPAAISALAVGGRIVVESYHSLEDRLVKRAFAAAATSSAPLGLPVELAEHQPHLRLLTKGAEKADPAELAHNPRAASVRLRAAERVREEVPE